MLSQVEVHKNAAEAATAAWKERAQHQAALVETARAADTLVSVLHSITQTILHALSSSIALLAHYLSSLSTPSTGAGGVRMFSCVDMPAHARLPLCLTIVTTLGGPIRRGREQCR